MKVHSTHNFIITTVSIFYIDNSPNPYIHVYSFILLYNTLLLVVYELTPC
jgi:hypothetical protein